MRAHGLGAVGKTVASIVPEDGKVTLWFEDATSMVVGAEQGKVWLSFGGRNEAVAVEQDNLKRKVQR